MTKKYKRHLITSALPYANGPLHIGHLAGAYLPADTYARYLRLKGEEVVYVCGSDEYGAAITMRAKKEGITPRQIIDKYHAQIKEAFARFGMSFDIYHRTSEAIHTQTSQEIFTRLHQQGKFTEQTSEQYYDEQAQQFLADRYIMGTCPKCGYERAYGDQCERCGSTLSPSELISPRSTLTNTTPVLRVTKHWYLPLNEYEPWLREWILKEKQDVWKANVYGQCRSWIEGGLQPRAMTRDLDWGIPVPLPEAAGKVLYVWLDAPIGYISATRAWAEQNGKNWEDYWKSDETRLLHFVGKDNIVFHCLIFPIVLKAHGEFILPDNVPANEFLNLEGDKLSTSRNWAVWLHEYLDELPGRTDELRYVLGSIAPETADSEFTWKDYQTRVNSELVAILGNFVNRTVVLMHKFLGGQTSQALAFTHPALQLATEQAYDAVDQHLANFKFKAGLFALMDLARTGNKYLTETEPWKTVKTDPAQAAEALHNALLLAAHLGVLCQPFLPETAQKIFKMLNLPQTRYAWQEPLVVPTGHPLNEPFLLFQKVEDADIERQIAKLQATKMDATTTPATPAPALAAAKSEIVYDDFAKLDLRVATVLACERVPKADKLLKLTLDTGLDQRTVVSGIAQYFAPEDLVGQQVMLVANLAPRPLRGITSQGMILTAQRPDGSLVLVRPTQPIEPGSTVS
ncbi:MAG: methionine--tRNA ligase, partial [Bernardetiaceae bacterium]|jgi:methionyl-tRNA synthetase|nr:methionine--tRNA ligase [Bernardetiaceae bacterium]